MPILRNYKLLPMGNGGLVVTIPKAWARYYHLRPGDLVKVQGNGKLIIRPIFRKGDKL